MGVIERIRSWFSSPGVEGAHHERNPDTGLRQEGSIQAPSAVPTTESSAANDVRPPHVSLEDDVRPPMT